MHIPLKNASTLLRQRPAFPISLYSLLFSINDQDTDSESDLLTVASNSQMAFGYGDYGYDLVDLNMPNGRRRHDDRDSLLYSSPADYLPLSSSPEMPSEETLTHVHAFPFPSHLHQSPGEEVHH